MKHGLAGHRDHDVNGAGRSIVNAPRDMQRVSAKPGAEAKKSSD
jgi:hypothetical protein